MQLTDFSFLLYFLPVMLAVYYLLFFTRKGQNLWLALCGLAFYAIGGAGQLVLMVGLIGMNHLLGLLVHRRSGVQLYETADAARKAKLSLRNTLAFTWVANLLPLFLLVYLPSLNATLSRWMGFSAAAFPATPLGAAFLALQGISYVMDIHRGKAAWNPSIVRTAVYFTFFPALFAGPIIRFGEVAEQIENRTITLDKIGAGLCRFVVGLAKIVLLAQPLLSLAEIVADRSNLSAIYTTVPVSLALLGLAAYTIAVYHYFSGFSDLVIGLGKMLGFDLPENFQHPHLAASVTVFWRRCYRSLTGWFEEYVYQPLSKKRTTNDHMVLHMLLMWLLIGLWLGPGIPNLLFGFWNFMFILIEKIVETDHTKTRSPLRHVYVVLVMLVSMTALRADGIYQFTLYLSNLFGMRDNGFTSSFALLLLRENWVVLAAGLLFSFPIATKIRGYAEKNRNMLADAVNVAYPVAMAALVVLLVLQLSATSYDPGLASYTRLWS